jgi:hypothetical protein
LLIQSLIHVEPQYGPEGHHIMKIPGAMVTDVKSSRDRLNSTGKMPNDPLVVWDLVEAGTAMLR